MNQIQNVFGSLEIGIWILFVIWCLEFFQLNISKILDTGFLMLDVCFWILDL